MSSLLNAPPYDEVAEKRRKRNIVLAVVLFLVIVGLAWHFRFVRQERIVNHFFDAIEAGDMSKAYGVYFNDPDWKQHPADHSEYPLGDFQRDWGSSSEYGHIQSHEIVDAGDIP